MRKRDHIFICLHIVLVLAIDILLVIDPSLCLFIAQKMDITRLLGWHSLGKGFYIPTLIFMNLSFAISILYYAFMARVNKK